MLAERERERERTTLKEANGSKKTKLVDEGCDRIY
jgi:hypothetical protein